MTINSFRDLRVWQAAMELVTDVYGLTKVLPRDESHGLVAQMQRAAVSVPSNIAESHTREYSREYLQHLSVAQGSLAELQTQLDIAVRLGYALPERVEKVLQQAAAISKQLYALRNAVARGIGMRARGRETGPSPQPPSPNPQQGGGGGGA